MSGTLHTEERARADLTRIGRRRFLGLGIGLAAAATAPLGCGGVPDRLRPGPGPALRRLSDRAYATFTAAAMRLAGPRAASWIEERRIDVGRTADGFVDREPSLAEPLGQALWALEFAVPPWAPKWRPFTALDDAAQDQVLDALMRSRFDLARDVFRGVRSLALLSVYTQPEAVAAIGHPGPFGSARVRIEDAMRYPIDPGS